MLKGAETVINLDDEILNYLSDSEESDIDDHERPAPPKRQCTGFIKIKETLWEEAKNWDVKEDTIRDSENIEYDEAERYTREELIKWQMCQLTAAFLDNIINKSLENYLMGASSSYPLQESRFQTIRGNDMEDTAVLMAIRSHGLVRSVELVSQSNAFYSGNFGNFGNSIAATSTDSMRLNNSSNMEDYNDWDLDKVDDNDQQENFLERAVAEAIKKKGLIALSNSRKEV
ncbi:uncharacterized protein LOC117226815 [Megalopta genalis]|uniref:uncharacterized protein LOC117226815 n=1 Tax=Megalopta genalis TaxID=115081 RepID=UPI001442F1AB|nr:uncharacterized protein LOC117226815 [Megalopta genalis]XP_033337425.1 uncharacterized protein LOC117226815 [Megalopta genalis]XP_033337427.1 uncharacterized protein LOC117226815 [Megalopta genalis]XP_033337428.1 uncharacterized protein LOC117226815 [Megalopta genalis]